MKENIFPALKRQVDIIKGYILSTCNNFTRDIPARNALAMYNEAEKYIIGEA